MNIPGSFIFRIVLAFALLLPCPNLAASPLATPVSLPANQFQYPDLADTLDPLLQAGLEERVAKLGLAMAAKRKQLCLALVDITAPQVPRLAMINGREMMYAASLPKIAILFGACQKLDAGELTADPELMRNMRAMIKRSSNSAATYVLNRVGKQDLLDLLTAEPYRLYDETGEGGLWVGKEYGKSPAYKRDPIKNLSHAATAFQVARFYYMLETNRLASPNSCTLMKDMLSDSAINHKFVAGLKSAQPDACVFRKSGTWSCYHADSAIVERDGRKYIAVGLAESNQGGAWLKKVIVAMDDLVFDTAPASSQIRVTQ